MLLECSSLLVLSGSELLSLVMDALRFRLAGTGMLFRLIGSRRPTLPALPLDELRGSDARGKWLAE